MVASKIFYLCTFLFLIAFGVFDLTVYEHQVPTLEIPDAEPTLATNLLATPSYATTTKKHTVSTTSVATASTATPAKTLKNTASTSVKNTDTRIGVLVVAGHEPNYGGAEYRLLKERDMTLRISRYLSDYLRTDTKFDVTVVRDEKGWNPVFTNYFKTNATATKNFYLAHMALMTKQIAQGEVTSVVGVPHNKAPEDVALRLYGVNRLADEYKMDLVIHLHFNDIPRKNVSLPGEYTGIAVYVPERQYTNSSTSIAIAHKVFPYLMKYSATSTLPTEHTGIIEDQELIALGKYNTLKAPSLLIEYGYMYEPQFQNYATADTVFKNLALQTYKGIADYFSLK